jgi:hypothetical protein
MGTGPHFRVPNGLANAAGGRLNLDSVRKSLFYNNLHLRIRFV